MWNKVLSVILAVSLVTGLNPAAAYAADVVKGGATENNAPITAVADQATDTAADQAAPAVDATVDAVADAATADKANTAEEPKKIEASSSSEGPAVDADANRAQTQAWFDNLQGSDIKIEDVSKTEGKIWSGAGFVMYVGTVPGPHTIELTVSDIDKFQLPSPAEFVAGTADGKNVNVKCEANKATGKVTVTYTAPANCYGLINVPFDFKAHRADETTSVEITNGADATGMKKLTAKADRYTWTSDTSFDGSWYVSGSSDNPLTIKSTPKHDDGLSKIYNTEATVTQVVDFSGFYFPASGDKKLSASDINAPEGTTITLKYDPSDSNKIIGYTATKKYTGDGTTDIKDAIGTFTTSFVTGSDKTGRVTTANTTYQKVTAKLTVDAPGDIQGKFNPNTSTASEYASSTPKSYKDEACTQEFDNFDKDTKTVYTKVTGTFNTNAGNRYFMLYAPCVQNGHKPNSTLINAMGVPEVLTFKLWRDGDPNNTITVNKTVTKSTDGYYYVDMGNLVDDKYHYEVVTKNIFDDGKMPGSMRIDTSYAISSNNNVAYDNSAIITKGNNKSDSYYYLSDVSEEAGITLRKTASGSSANALTYNLTVKNDNDTTKYVTIVDNWPAGVELTNINANKAAKNCTVRIEFIGGKPDPVMVTIDGSGNLSSEFGKISQANRQKVAKITFMGIPVAKNSSVSPSLTCKVYDTATSALPYIVNTAEGPDGTAEVQYFLGATIQKYAYKDVNLQTGELKNQYTTENTAAPGGKVYYVVNVNVDEKVTETDLKYMIRDTLPARHTFNNMYYRAGESGAWTQVTATQNGQVVESAEKQAIPAKAKGQWLIETTLDADTPTITLTNSVVSDVYNTKGMVGNTPSASATVSVVGAQKASATITKSAKTVATKFWDNTGKGTPMYRNFDADTRNTGIYNGKDNRTGVGGGVSGATPFSYVFYKIQISNAADSDTLAPIEALEDVFEGGELVGFVSYSYNATPSNNAAWTAGLEKYGYTTTNVKAVNPTNFETKITDNFASGYNFNVYNSGYAMPVSGADGNPIGWAEINGGTLTFKGPNGEDALKLAQGKNITIGALCLVEDSYNNQTFQNAATFTAPDWVEGDRSASTSQKVLDYNPGITKVVSQVDRLGSLITPAEPAIVEKSDKLQYTVNVSKNGPGYLHGFTLIDEVPEGYAFFKDSTHKVKAELLDRSNKVVKTVDVSALAQDAQDNQFTVDLTTYVDTTNRAWCELLEQMREKNYKDVRISYWIEPVDPDSIGWSSTNTVTAQFENYYIQPADCSTYDIDAKSITNEVTHYNLGSAGMLIQKAQTIGPNIYTEDKQYPTRYNDTKTHLLEQGESFVYNLDVTPKFAQDTFTLKQMTVTDRLPYVGDTRNSQFKVSYDEANQQKFEVFFFGDSDTPIAVASDYYDVVYTTTTATDAPDVVTVTFKDAFFEAFKREIADERILEVVVPVKAPTGVQGVKATNDYETYYLLESAADHGFTDPTVPSNRVTVGLLGTDYTPVITKTFEGVQGIPANAQNATFTIAPNEGTPALPQGYQATKGFDTNEGAVVGQVTFDRLSYTEPGTYTYTIKEDTGNKFWKAKNPDGITLTVQVLLNEATQELYTRTSYTDGAQIINEPVTPDPIQVPISTKKQLGKGSGTLTDDQFTFTLTPAVPGSPMPASATATNKADGTVDFGKITFTEDNLNPGMYAYTITETSQSGWTVEPANGITVLVNLELDDQNVIRPTVAYSDEGYGFTNTNVVPLNTTIDAWKALGGPLSIADYDGKFVFTVTAQDGAPVPAGVAGPSWTATNDATGHVVFADANNPIVIDPTTFIDQASKTFTYKIKETANNSGNPSIGTDDQTEITYTVVVTYNASKGVYEKTSETYSGGTGSAFNTITNPYIEPGGTPIQINKVVSGEDAPTIAQMAGKFKFELTPNAASNPMPAGAVEGKVVAYNDVNGLVDFGGINYIEADTYYYTITETEVPTGWTKCNPINVKVVVTKNGNKLDAVATYNDLPFAEFTANNPFQKPEPTTVNIEASKTIFADEGIYLPPLKDGQFSFNLNKVVGADKQFVETKPVVAKTETTGEIKFSTINIDPKDFVLVDTITYTYEITENQPADPSYIDLYDEGIVTATFTVTKNSENKLVASDVTYTKTDGTATNEFKNKRIKPEPTSMSIVGTKALAGQDLGNLKFQFQITETDSNARQATNVPATVENNGANFAFNNIGFTEPGTYTFMVEELVPNPKDENVIYDDTKYNVTVVIDYESATSTNLAVQSVKIGETALAKTDAGYALPTYTKADQTASFVNVKEKGTLKIAKSFRPENIPVNENMAFTVTGPSFPNGTTVMYSAFTNGEYDFGQVYVGTYTVTETNYSVPGYSWSAQYTTGTAGIDVVRAAENVLGITNVYEPGNISATIGATKALLYGQIADDQFSFTMTQKTGTTVLPAPETVTNKGNLIKFDGVTFNYAGEYTFEVAEVTNNDDQTDPIIYDTAKYTVKITIATDGDGLKVDSVTVDDDPTKIVADATGTYMIPEKESKVPAIKGSFINETKKGYLAITKTFVSTDADDQTDLSTLGDNVTFTVTGPSFPTGTTVKYSEFNDKANKKHNFGEVIRGTYTVVETNENLNGYQHVSTTYKVGTTETQDAVVEPLQTTTLDVTNTYTPSTTTAVLVGTKALVDRQIKAGEFEFAIQQTTPTGKPQAVMPQATTTNDANGDFAFGAITFKWVGDYTFVVTEHEGVTKDEGMAVDPTVEYDKTTSYTVTVKVVAAGTGLKVDSVTGATVVTGKDGQYELPKYTKQGYADWDGTPQSGTASFVNLTKHGNLRLTKTMTDTYTSEDMADQAPQNLRFKVYGPSFPDGQVVYYHESAAPEGQPFMTRGEYTFNNIIVGDYSVIEVSDPAPGDSYVPSGTIAGYTITVTEGGNTVVPDQDVAVTITNEYLPGTVYAAFNGTKALMYDVHGTFAADMFKFQLADITEYTNPLHAAVLPADVTVTNDADGNFAFDKITFRYAGDYTFTVKEATAEDDQDPTIAYDPIEYTIVVKVVNDGDNVKVESITCNDKDTIESSEVQDDGFVLNKFELPKKTMADPTVLDEQGAATEKSASFLNEKKKGELTIVKTISSTDPNYREDLESQAAGLTFTVTGPSFLAGESVTYDQFTQVEGSEARSYTFTEVIPGDYTVVETNAAIPGYTVVTTYKVGEDETNQLAVEATQTSTINVSNVYTPGTTELKIAGTKAVTAEDLQAGQYKFVIIPIEVEEGQPLADMPAEGFTATNDAEGNFVFDAIKFHYNGSYKFLVAEFVGEDPTIDYDAQQYIVVVNVKDVVDTVEIESVTANDQALTVTDGVATLPVKTVAGKTASFVNTYYGAVSINGTKTWVDYSNEDGTRPEAITLVVTAKAGDKAEEIQLQSEDPTMANYLVWTKPAGKDVWTYTITNLAKYNAEGVLLTYNVTEVVPDKYVNNTNSVDVVFKDGVGVADFTNTYTRPPETPKRLAQTGDPIDVAPLGLLALAALAGIFLPGFRRREE